MDATGFSSAQHIAEVGGVTKAKKIAVVRGVLALFILALTFYLADFPSVIEQLSSLRLSWLVLGAVTCHITYWCMAWRWWYVAGQIGAKMSYRQSLSDYLLGGLSNQVLPTGLAGPVIRAYRHSKRVLPGEDGTTVGMGKAVSAVVLDRLAGLAAQALIAIIGALALVASFPWVGLWGIVAGGISLGAMTIALRAARVRYPEFQIDLEKTFAGVKAQALIAAISILSVILLSLAFYFACLAMSLELSLWRVLCVSPLILGAMVIPLSIAGWGVREAAAAALLTALGTSSGTGVAVSVTFGLMSLLSTLPAIGIWLASFGSSEKRSEQSSGEQ